MKHINTTLFALLLSTLFSLSLHAQSPKREFRAAWVSTAWNLDWPSSSTASASTQQTELRTIIDKFHAANFNAVFLQVRGFCDAFYKSSYEPWSYYLTGTRGKAPSYDPLQVAIDYAHSLGMELHAWVNPYRYSSSVYNYGTLSTDYAKTNPSWIMHDKNDSYVTILNPGIPAVRQRIADVVAEIVRNYDVDGIVFDDYFYPSSATQDSEDATYYSQYNPQGLSRADWRRDQVNQMVALVNTTIKSIKPYVRFGISPAGVAGAGASKYGVSKCPVGSDWQYNGIYSDPLAWIYSQTIDYISPQIYWAIGSSNDYKQICNWWSGIANKFGRHFYSSHSLSNLSSWGADEYVNQVAYNRQYDKNGAPGSVFFNSEEGTNSSTFLSTIKGSSFTALACMPIMTWHTATTLAAPSNLSLSGSTLSWSHPSAVRFTVYAYTKGQDPTVATASSSNLVGIVYGKSINLSTVSNLSSKTLAVCAYDRYGNEFAPALYNAVNVNPVITVSTSSVSFSAKQGASPAPYADVTITAADLLADLSISTAGPVIASTQSGWNARTGGRLRITLDTQNEAGTYNGSVTIASGSTSAVVSVKATIQTPDIEQGTVTFDPRALWTQTPSTLSCLSTSASNRSMAYYDGKLYITDRDAAAYHIINASTGAFQQTIYVGYSDFEQHNIRITSDGQMLFGNTGSGSTDITLRTWDMNNRFMTDLSAVAIGGRSDYFYPYGEWNKSGFLLALANSGALVKIPYANGEQQTASTLSAITLQNEPDGSGAKSAKAIPASSTAFYATATYNIPVKYTISGTSVQQAEQFGTTQPASVAASGLGIFSLHGNTYMITPTTATGGFDIFDITNGLSKAKRVISPVSALGSRENNAMTIEYCTHVEGNNAYIYELAPQNSLRAYKFTFTPSTTALEEITVKAQILPTFTGVDIRFEGTQPVTIYTINGTQLTSAVATNRFTFDLPQGAYIIRIGAQAHKFVK